MRRPSFVSSSGRIPRTTSQRIRKLSLTSPALQVMLGLTNSVLRSSRCTASAPSSPQQSPSMPIAVATRLAATTRAHAILEVLPFNAWSVADLTIPITACVVAPSSRIVLIARARRLQNGPLVLLRPALVIGQRAPRRTGRSDVQRASKTSVRNVAVNVPLSSPTVLGAAQISSNHPPKEVT